MRVAQCFIENKMFTSFQREQHALTCGFAYKQERDKKGTIFHTGAGKAKNRVLTKCCKTDLCNTIVPPIPKHNWTSSKSFNSVSIHVYSQLKATDPVYTVPVLVWIRYKSVGSASRLHCPC